MSAEFFTVKSNSSNRAYIVRKLPNGEWKCSCPGFIFRNDCKHIEKAQNSFRNAVEKVKEKQREYFGGKRL
jgi:hypothetical protein